MQQKRRSKTVAFSHAVMLRDRGSIRAAIAAAITAPGISDVVIFDGARGSTWKSREAAKASAEQPRP